TGRRHDLVALALSDPRELELPSVGLVELEDAETGRTLLVDTGSTDFRAALKERSAARLAVLRQLARSGRIDLVEIGTDGNHLEALTRFFHLREHRLGRV